MTSEVGIATKKFFFLRGDGRGRRGRGRRRREELVESVELISESAERFGLGRVDGLSLIEREEEFEETLKTSECLIGGGREVTDKERGGRGHESE